jgi:hypothetical protein
VSVAERMEARERLSAAAREAGLDPERLLAMLETGAPQRPEPPPPPAPVRPRQTDAAIFAAICDTFTYDELKAATGKGEAERDEMVALLSEAAPVVLGGQRRLRLLPEARREILSACRDSAKFRKLLVDARTAPPANGDDAAGRQNYWIREFLAGTAVPLETLGIDDLAAAAAALDALEGVPLGTQAPSGSEARRLLDFARLIEPLRILVGAVEGGPGKPAGDRFVGRAADLTILRAHVDELESESYFEGFQRAVTRVSQKTSQFLGGRSPGPLVIEARGGLGKSTLIAKFVLDHATGGSRRFGFAYLDFDRAGLQPQPAQLLSEVARQAALQFPETRRSLEELRLAVNGGGSSDSLPLDRQFDRFRELVRQAGEGRPFLLVLDTMEVVQYNPQWLEGVVAFARALHGGHFNELRLVAAGRADIVELREETDFWGKGALHTLQPLSVLEARQMVSRLGRDLMPGAWNEAWARKIAGQSAQPANRREPLSLRVAVELMRSIDEPAEREKFADEIAEAGDAHDSFVGKLYQRRILDHVRDPEVRKLAWPGLVLRTITPELVRSVLAGPCELDPADIDRIFDALGREVWIVRREGDALRHRADLRARTLPLMRRKDPEKFARINRAAVAHFAGDRSLEGWAEWLYHRLLDGESPETVDRDWNEDLAPFLAGAADDFLTDLPAAAAYLQARTSRKQLAAAQLASLPEGLAFDHVARIARRLAQFDDHRASPIVLDLALRAGRVSRGALAPEAEAARQAILIKSGQWQSEALEYGHGTDPHGPYYSPNYDVSRSLYTARSALPGGDRLWPSVEAQNRLVELFLQAPRPVQARARIQDLARLRGENHPLWRDLDLALARMLDRSSVGAAESGDLAAWRLCAVVGEASGRGAARRWAKASARRHGSGLSPAIAERELLALAGCGSWPMFADILGPQLRALDFNPGDLRSRSKAALDPEASMFSGRARIESPELAHAIHRFVSVLSDSADMSDVRALRTFCAIRSEDWIVPLGYTLLRRHGRTQPPPEVMHLLHADDKRGWFSRISGRRPLPITDPLVMLRRADEGGQIGAVLDFYARHLGDPEADQDLWHLADLHLRWRAMLAECARR